MRVLHTSDWHIGQRLINFDRDLEHKNALEFLIETINNEKIDLLLVAGDIFDNFNPSTAAQELYFNFLVRLKKTTCKNVVIIGGNHDSPALLNASKSLLKALNIFVVGAMPVDPKDAILEIKSGDQLKVIVCAIPFLRDRELKYFSSGESAADRVQAIRHGIHEKYKLSGQLSNNYIKYDIPIISTGHLYAKGAIAVAGQDNIYVGDMANISAEEFPEIFDYVALGHLHRAQTVGGNNFVRYSGSLIPLSFSEIPDNKSVTILDFSRGKRPEIKTIEVPVFRRLKSISGKFQEIMKVLKSFIRRHEDDELAPWIEILIETDKLIPGLEEKIRSEIQNSKIEVLKIRVVSGKKQNNVDHFKPDLFNMQVEEVFKLKCEQLGIVDREYEEIFATFTELRELESTS